MKYDHFHRRLYGVEGRHVSHFEAKCVLKSCNRREAVTKSFSGIAHLFLYKKAFLLQDASRHLQEYAFTATYPPDCVVD